MSSLVVAQQDFRDDYNPQSPRDEEAHLLASEQFEFEDDGGESVTRLPTSRPRRGLLGWLSGPQPSHPQLIKPFFPSYQEIPITFIKRSLPNRAHQYALLIIFIVIWVVAFTIPLTLGSIAIKDSTGRDVVNLDCIDTLWGRKNDCGLGGIDCQPFTNDTFTFQCPADCAGVKVWNEHAVGAQDVVYRPLVIGGPQYRGDSFICASGIHAGLLTDARGGCARLSRIGKHSGYPSSNSNGVESIGFDSYFPLAFTISVEPGLDCSSGFTRYILFSVSFLFTTALLVLTSSPRIFFVIFTAIFAHVSFVSDPPGASYRNVSTLPDHVSRFAERFLPAAFCAVVLYRTCIRKTLNGLTAQLEKTILWLGGFWFGALSNYTFDWIPIQRLTAGDIARQPGAKVALAVIIVILVLVVLQQAYYFRLEGRLLRYLALYGVFISAIVVSLSIPFLNLRIHHYVVALLLLPGTSIQTRPSLLYQGVLLGLFVNGVARWGFDSVLQTTAALRGDGVFGSLVPSIAAPVVVLGNIHSNISFTWAEPLSSASVDAVSVMVNDVERYRAYLADPISGPRNFTWSRAAAFPVPEYFRFGYLRDKVALDYTSAGIWHPNGTWEYE